MEQNPETWRLRPPVSLRCFSGSSSDWLGGSPGEEWGTLCCFPWPRAVTGPCPGLSRPQLHLPHCQLQSPPVRPVSCPAQRPLPGPCHSPQVRPTLDWGRRGGWGPTGAQAHVHVVSCCHSGHFSRPQSTFLALSDPHGASHEAGGAGGCSPFADEEAWARETKVTSLSSKSKLMVKPD